MSIFQLELNATEIKTRTIMNKVIDTEWSPGRTMVAQIFVKEWSSSLSAERVTKMAIPLFSLREDAYDDLIKQFQKVLTKLVKEGALRSRRAGAGSPKPSETLYEVNY